MDKKGTGYSHEMLIAFFILVLIITFYSGRYVIFLPPVMMLIGAVMLVGGMVVREPALITGGVIMFGVAIIYAETVVK